MLVSEEGSVLYANRQAEEILGCRPGTVTGERLEAFGGGILTRLVSPSRSPEREQEPIREEISFPDRNSRWRHVSVATASVSLSSGENATLFILCDITKQRRCERRLQTLTRILALVGSTARHDILNKIETIRGYVGLLFRVPADEKSIARLQTIDTAAEEIRDILFATRDFEGIGREDPAWFLFKDTFRDAVKKTILPGPVTISCSCPGFSVFADPLIVRVLEIFLFESSRDARPGSIALSCERYEDGLLIQYHDTRIAPAAEQDFFSPESRSKNRRLFVFYIEEIFAATGITIKREETADESICMEFLVPRPCYREPEEEDNSEGV